MAWILQEIVSTATEYRLDGSLGVPWFFLWNGRLNADAMGHAAKVRGITKELQFNVRVENPETPAEVITVTVSTKP